MTEQQDVKRDCGGYDPSSVVSVYGEPSHVMVTIGEGDRLAAKFACTYDVAVRLREELDRVIAHRDAWRGERLESQRVAPPRYPGDTTTHAVRG